MTLAGEACRRRGERAGVGECAGSVQDNPKASSLLQNKSDAKVIEIIFYCEKTAIQHVIFNRL